MKFAEDRTGESCPFCKKGTLHPTGKRDILEPAKTPASGEARRESTEYECDRCHKKTEALGIAMNATMTTSVKLEVVDNNKTKKIG